MSNLPVCPRILVVTPEVLFTPGNTGKRKNCKKSPQGGFIAILTALIRNLLEMGADVHVAQPDYRKIFSALLRDKRGRTGNRIPANRIHLAEDRTFFYSNSINSNSEWENQEIAIAFQREVSYQVVPRVQPDLIHCHGWMTGLIPAMAKYWRIPCLFTVQSLRTAKILLSRIEDRGIDGAAIWQHLFYDQYPGNYEESRNTNPFDCLLSGIFAAYHVNTANPLLLADILSGQNEFFDTHLRQVVAQKYNAGCAGEIFNLCDPACKPASSKKLNSYFGPFAYQPKEQKTNCAVDRQTPSYNNRDTEKRYIDLYEQILQRSLVKPEK